MDFSEDEKAGKTTRCIPLKRNTENNFCCNVEVMDQNKICTSLSKLDSKNIEEIKHLGIFVSDICLDENLRLYENDPKEIHILLGADTAARLFTGEIKKLSPDIIAMNTKLGWTVIGKSGINKNDSSSTLMSLHVNDVNISDLWRDDTLNINEPAGTQSRKELEEAAKEHFERSVTRDNEGRYIVSLPWIHDHPPLPDGRKIAERRLNSCIKTLERAEKLHSPIQDKTEEMQEDRKVPVLGLLWNFPKETISLDLKSLIKEETMPDFDVVNSEKRKSIVSATNTTTEQLERIVLIGDSNIKRINWPLGRVIKLYLGKDKKVRLVEVQTKSGSFLRPIQRLFLLEISQSEKSAVPCLPKSDSLSTIMIPDGTPTSSDSHAVPDVSQPRRSRYVRLLKPSVLLDSFV
ncbi:hypothetical protein HNY73_003133 [Argiope bruennichi]|uniref:DUF5641 domain-containing protein n=1 Tax=Argiope bruennichi TaxID=94029 RepID=A0A8T0FX09_ARGBR|nr:hypothetical protein HNY73_003133 [Argiope bruennichi]